MSYKILSSEKTRAKCSEFETRALLYMMNCREDSGDIDYFVIDFFNDLTAIDSMLSTSWDLQSKGKGNNFHGDIGKELVTLFKNYLSDFDFSHYILFLGGVADTVRINPDLDVFEHTNLQSKSKKRIKSALIKEAKAKTYILDTDITDENIDGFIKEVCFVIGNKPNEEYVLDIIKVNPNIIPSNDVLKKIFKTIRDAQSAKKNSGNIEGTEIEKIGDFIYYDRHIRKKDVTLMVLSRFINNDIMQKGITPSFTNIYGKLPDTERKDMLEDCKLSLAKTLFDKNNTEAFWKFLSNIYEEIVTNIDMSVDMIFDEIDKELVKKLQFMDFLTVKYFIAIIKDGIDEDY